MSQRERKLSALPCLHLNSGGCITERTSVQKDLIVHREVKMSKE